MLKLLVSNIQNLQNAKFYSCQIKLVYSMLSDILNVNSYIELTSSHLINTVWKQ